MISSTRALAVPVCASSAALSLSSFVGSSFASLKTYQACSAASITACLACSSSVNGAALVVDGADGGVVVAASRWTVMGGRAVVAGTRIVDGAVLGTAALVAGGSGVPALPQA